MGRLVSIAALSCFAALLAACGSAPPKRPLQPGYYVLDEGRFGVTRRIVIAAGERRASYDVWRVSDRGDGTAKHAHFDLVAADDVPSSGTFAITQEGTNCGTLTIEPYQNSAGVVIDDILTVRYGLLGIEHFHVLGEGDAVRYRQYDDAFTRRIAEIAADTPRIYAHLSPLGKFFYSELNPSCWYD